MEKIEVGVIGATGMVGQNYVKLLHNHPWFEVTYVAASPGSAKKRYEDAVAGRWHMKTPIPDGVRDLVVGDANRISQTPGNCRLLFSAVEMDKSLVAALELEYASRGFAVVSNNSAHRFTADVPMIIPEVNPHHLDIIPEQRKRRGWDNGLIVAKSNCNYLLHLIGQLSCVMKLTVLNLKRIGASTRRWRSSSDDCAGVMYLTYVL